MHKKIIKCLKNPEMVFQTAFMPNRVLGTYEHPNVITINLTEVITPVVIHECIHALNPKLDEETVIEQAETIVDSMSFKQKVKMFKLFMQRVRETEVLESAGK